MNFPNEANEALSTLLNVLFYILIFISLIYGTKIKIWNSSRTIKEGLETLKTWNDETRQLTISKFKEFSKDSQSLQDIEKKIDEFLNFVTIPPVELDPYGIVPKIEHILNSREIKYLNEVRDLATTADETQIRNLGKRLEEKNMNIELSDKAKEFIANVSYDPVYGARPLKRTIQKYIQDPLANKLLKGEFNEGDNISIDLGSDKKLNFNKKK